MRTTMDLAPQAAGPDRVDADIGVDRIFREHRLSMVRLALLFVDDRGTAEEVAQDAFAALHRKWRSLSSDEAALGYLRACVVNGSRSVLRRRRIVRRHPQPVGTGLTAAPADDAVLLAEEHREVLAALRKLPTKQRQTIVLIYWAGLNEAQTAAALGVTAGAVKSNASRGRAAIARQLEGTS